MSMTANKLNFFTLLKLPAAYFCGVRTLFIDTSRCIVSVKHRWINQNPFKSMFWAVQGMAAELSTGALVMGKIKATQKPISMLVISNKAVFTKKVTGRVLFTCHDGQRIDKVIADALRTGEGQTIWLQSTGVNKDGVVVSTFDFEWSIKVKPVKKHN